MQSTATTVAAYLRALPADRRRALEAIRTVIKANLDPAFDEGMQYGMIGYYVPHRVYPAGYHCDPRQPLPFASLASQKNHIGIYLMCIYMDPKQQAQFVKDWKASGKKLDMGKSCVRVKDLDGVALDAVGKAIKRISAKQYIARYEANLGRPHGAKPTPKRAAAKAKTQAPKRTAAVKRK